MPTLDQPKAARARTRENSRLQTRLHVTSDTSFVICASDHPFQLQDFRPIQHPAGASISLVSTCHSHQIPNSIVVEMPSDRILGKRKRKPVEKAEDSTDAAALEDAQAIFRRHFEAQFAPLEDETEDGTGKAGKSKKTVADEDIEDANGDGIEDMRSDSESEDDGEWDGVSGEDSSDGS